VASAAHTYTSKAWLVTWIAVATTLTLVGAVELVVGAGWAQALGALGVGISILAGVLYVFPNRVTLTPAGDVKFTAVLRTRQLPVSRMTRLQNFGGSVMFVFEKTERVYVLPLGHHLDHLTSELLTRNPAVEIIDPRTT
jgi:hypothetical protein